MRIVDVKVIEVSWRPPAVPNGVIIRYTIYITPFGVSSDDGTGDEDVQASNFITAVSSQHTYLHESVALVIVTE